MAEQARLARERYEVLVSGLSDTSEAPTGKDIFYRCHRCKRLIPSRPKDNIGCARGNIFIDIDYARLAVRDLTQFEAVRRR